MKGMLIRDPDLAQRVVRTLRIMGVQFISEPRKGGGTMVTVPDDVDLHDIVDRHRNEPRHGMHQVSTSNEQVAKALASLLVGTRTAFVFERPSSGNYEFSAFKKGMLTALFRYAKDREGDV